MRIRLLSAAAGVSALALVAAFTPVFSRTPQVVSDKTATASMPEIPMWFERNSGEYPSQVQFASRSLNQTVFLTESEMVIAASGVPQPLKIQWRNGNRAARRMSGENPVKARIDNFRGKNSDSWKTGDIQPRYASVRYEQVYNGIDLVFHPQGSQLEHDFVVAPGVDPKQIALHFDGASRMTLDSQDGSLALEMSATETVRQSKPVAYQEIDGKRVAVAAAYRVTGEREVAFELGAYDATRELIIDPVLKYASFLGGTRGTKPSKIIAEAGNGILWITGTTSSTDFPAVGDPIRDVATMGNGDIFIAKVDTTKSGLDGLLYAAFVGGTGLDEARSLVLDRDGNAVISGMTASADFPIVGSYDTTIEGGRDAVVLKIDPRRGGTDALVYTTFVGGDGEDYGNAVTTDSNGRIIVAGYTTSENFPLTANAIQRNRQKGYELFIARIDPDAGTSGLQYSTYYGGSGTDVANAVAVDAAGLIYVAGSTTSDNFPTSDNAYRATYQGAGDMFLIRVDPAKSSLDGINYGTYFGGSGIDSAEAMHRDADGNIYLAGYTTSNDMSIAGSAPQIRNAGGADAFVLKIAIPTNQLLFASYLGGSSSDIAYGMNIDPTGRIHITGYTFSRDFNITRNAVQSTFGGAYDAFFASFNPALPAAESLVHSSFWGGDSVDNGLAITADTTGCNVSLVGTTSSKKMKVTENAFQSQGTGSVDAFLASANICQ